MSALKYNLSLVDLKIVDSKIEKQKKFLSEFSIDIFESDYNLLEASMGANINPKKYFAEVNNRVNSLFEYSKMLDLYPVFLTQTLPPQFHFNSKKYDGSSVKDGVRYLSERWAKFLRLKIFKNIKKSINHNMIYIRVIEPHKDGTPHAHVLIFIPKNFILPVKKVFKRHFAVDGASKLAQDFRYTWSGHSGGAVAYIMKYINKTFKHALEDRMTLEAYYYAFHSIRRFTTSQTLLPLYIHRKIKHNEKFRDFIYSTVKYKDQSLYSIYNKKIFLFRYMTEDDGLCEDVIYCRNPDLDKLFPKKSYVIPTTIKKHPQQNNYKKLRELSSPIYINDKLSDYCFAFGRSFIPKKPYHEYSDFDLLSYFNHLLDDIQDFNHYKYIHNLCFERGLIDFDYVDIF